LDAAPPPHLCETERRCDCAHQPGFTALASSFLIAVDQHRPAPGPPYLAQILTLRHPTPVTAPAAPGLRPLSPRHGQWRPRRWNYLPFFGTFQERIFELESPISEQSQIY
jgi:hypothetical protein